jgi:hypothetical protein
MNINGFQINKLKEALSNKGYIFFDNGLYNLNIVGIRSRVRESGKFDDLMLVVYKDNKDNDFIIESFPITTDAGTYWLKNPMNTKGTALLVPNQYRASFELGYHQGKYKALVQCNPLRVYRDNNKDYIADYDPSTIETGMFGINIHRSNPNVSSWKNDKWSAGCQVFQNPIHYLHFIQLCEKSSKLYGNKFTYTLLDQVDIEEKYV